MLDNLDQKYLPIAARLLSDTEYINLLDWFEIQKVKIAADGMTIQDVNMAVRYQGAFILLEELIHKLRTAREFLHKQQDLANKKRNL